MGTTTVNKNSGFSQKGRLEVATKKKDLEETCLFADAYLIVRAYLFALTYLLTFLVYAHLLYWMRIVVQRTRAP